MFRFILPTIIIAIALAGFFTFTQPIYRDISASKLEAASYNEALSNSKALETERDKLTKKYNTISSENMSKLTKMLPENVDNIRLILEIEKIAAPYGMVLKDVKYDTSSAEEKPAAGGQQALQPAASRKDYGTWELQFSTTGTYNNFLNFLKSLEKNLRIVDIVSIKFSSVANQGTGGQISAGGTQQYKYDFKIKTYWLKN